MEFLNFTASDFEGNGEDAEDANVHGEAKERDQRHSVDNTAQVNEEELVDEIKMLNIGNEEETAFIDINYWRPVIDYDIDGLLSELRQ